MDFKKRKLLERLEITLNDLIAINYLFLFLIVTIAVEVTRNLYKSKNDECLNLMSSLNRIHCLFCSLKV